MKYCVRCGAEHIDEAVFCTRCGVLLNTPQQTVSNPTETKNLPQREFSKAADVLGFVSNIMSIVSFLFIMLSVADAWIYSNATTTATNSYSSYGYSYGNNYYTVVSAYWYPNDEFAGIAVFFAVVAFVLALCCLIVTSNKRTKLKYVLSAITKTVFAAVLGIISLALLGMLYRC